MNKTAVITGASRGIGRAIAVKLAKEGYHLVLNSRIHTSLLLDLQAELEHTYGIQCMAFPGDVGDSKFVQKMFEQTVSRFPTLDLIVNNAGISYVGLLTDMTVEEWAQLMDTNLNAAFYCCKYGIPRMVSQKSGKIIQISSVWGCVGASCEAAYSASKGGINALTQALAKELAPSNIQVNAIACGAIDTEMNQFLTEEDRNALMEEIPANRLGTPSEVADLVYSLANSPSYLTGQIIKLDGGWQ